LRLKQNVYPVLYLSQGDTPRYIPYAGIRTQSVVMATEFALSAGLLVGCHFSVLCNLVDNGL